MTTFLEVARGLGIPVAEAGTHHHVSDGWAGMDCPRCSPGTGRYRLGYNLAGAYLSCWVCGGLPLFDVLSELAGKPVGHVIDAMKGVPREARVSRPRGKLTYPSGVGMCMPQHTRYLEERGFDPWALRKLWKLKGTGLLSDIPWRVFIPVHLLGEAVSWTARSIQSDHPKKYHNAQPHQESMPMKHTLYGIDHCRHAVIVHEGPADVWKTGPGAVATMGLGYSREQLSRLSRFPVRAVCFDSEPAAQERARRLCEALAPFPGETHRVELDSDDPGCATPREVSLLRRFLK